MIVQVDLKSLVFGFLLAGPFVGCASSTTEEQQELEVLADEVVELAGKNELLLAVDNPALMSSQTGKTGIVVKGDGESDKDEIIAAMSEKQWDLAVSLSRSFLTKYPGNTDALAFLASSYITLDDYPKARFYANMVLKSDPKNSIALNASGIINWKQAIVLEDFRQALGFFNVANQVTNKDFASALNLGFMQLRLGNLESSWTEFRNAEKACSNCIMAKIGKALAAQRLGKYDESYSSLNDALELDEEHPLVAYLLAIYYLEEKSDVETAKEWADKVADSSRADYELQEKAREVVNDVL